MEGNRILYSSNLPNLKGTLGGKGENMFLQGCEIFRFFAKDNIKEKTKLYSSKLLNICKASLWWEEKIMFLQSSEFWKDACGREKKIMFLYSSKYLQGSLEKEEKITIFQTSTSLQSIIWNWRENYVSPNFRNAAKDH